MLNAVIRLALKNRMLVAAASLMLLLYGGWRTWRLPIDVFPNLNRPRVTVIVEAPGMAPEEVETLITFPLETAFNGATGVEAVRSSSGVGISVVNVEFDWGSDIYVARQIVNERLAQVIEQLPEVSHIQIAPITSIMGQIMVVGLIGQDQSISPMELRTLADWEVRPRLMTIPGVSQVMVMGGERKQFQVLVDPRRLRTFDVSLGEVKTALAESNRNAAGGYLDQQGPHELLVRSLGRVRSVEEISRIVVRATPGRAVRLSDVARVVSGPQVKRGDGAAYVRDQGSKVRGGKAVLLTINKQPDADTRRVTEEVTKALDDLRSSLPKSVVVLPNLYQQRTFIDRAVANVLEALGIGAALVLVVLFLFLMNLRTTFITLTAIPLSIVVTGLVFAGFDLSINTMTLGGLAVAIGELVDDAIVDVENIFRRLKENARSPSRKPPLLVVYQASVEIRNSIVFATLIVALVFVPLFALGGMEGRLFRPLALAYIVSIVSSLAVSLTVTPVLSYWLLKNIRPGGHQEGFVLGFLQRIAGWVIRGALKAPAAVLITASLCVLAAGVAAWRLERDFLPPFNEGAVQINVLLPAGASLSKSNEVVDKVERRLLAIPDISALLRRTGRAELDEHAEGVNASELIATIDPESKRSREQIIDDIGEAVADVPGVATSVEQPIAHLISHMLSGVKAQVAVKLYGDDLETLRRIAGQIKADIEGVEGVRDLQVEQQSLIPQLRIEIDGRKLESYGLRRGDINALVETAMQGQAVSPVLEGQRSFDLVVRLDDRSRENIDELRRLAIELPGGGVVKLEDVANIYESSGPNTINRESVRRRIVVQCNVSGRGVVDVVKDIKQRLAPIETSLPAGYFLEYGGQFEGQQSAARTIIALFLLTLVGMFLLLYKMFGSANLALQVMAALPMAFIGSVGALILTGQTLTIASMVGFISLCGIATRNGILLINHYLHLVQFEGYSLSHEMIVKAGQQRLSPVLMTALTAGIGLVPLVLAAGEPGKEILYPVATVIVGGLLTSTALEFLVRPALFATLGVSAARRLIARDSEEVELVEEKAQREQVVPAEVME